MYTEKAFVGAQIRQMLSTKEQSKAFADSHDFRGVVETAGHFPAIYLQTFDSVIANTLQVYMRKIKGSLNWNP